MAGKERCIVVDEVFDWRATSDTNIPGAYVSWTIRAFSSAVQRRRRCRADSNRATQIPRKIRVFAARKTCTIDANPVLARFVCTQKPGNGSSLARRTSTLTRPYIARFKVFSRLICPSTCPLDHFVVNAFRTADKSFRKPRANARMP
jgi:hypothetical protein